MPRFFPLPTAQLYGLIFHGQCFSVSVVPLVDCFSPFDLVRFLPSENFLFFSGRLFTTLPTNSLVAVETAVSRGRLVAKPQIPSPMGQSAERTGNALTAPSKGRSMPWCQGRKKGLKQQLSTLSLSTESSY